MIRKLSACLLCCIFLSGCTVIPYDASLQPRGNYPQDKVVHNRPVFVKISDDRLSEVIGYRRSDFMDTGEITLRQIDSVFKQETVRGLEARGFNVVDSQNPDIASLRLSIKNIEYKAVPEILTGKTRVSMAASVRSVNNGQEFERTYRSSTSEDGFFFNTSDENQSLLDKSATQLLEKILKDESLIMFLSS